MHEPSTSSNPPSGYDIAKGSAAALRFACQVVFYVSVAALGTACVAVIHLLTAIAQRVRQFGQPRLVAGRH